MCPRSERRIDFAQSEESLKWVAESKGCPLHIVQTVVAQSLGPVLRGTRPRQMLKSKTSWLDCVLAVKRYSPLKFAQTALRTLGMCSLARAWL